MELWDVYDINRNKTGKTAVRGEKLPEGGFHLVVHVCILGSDGRMLIQQRQPFKHGFSGMWDVSAGGSAVAGETSAMAAMREVRAVKWATEEEIFEMMDSGAFIPYFKGYISTIFHTADQYGSIRER